MTEDRIDVLISQAEIDTRLTEMAAEIDRDHTTSDTLICVGVLKGSLFFLADLVRRLRVPVEIDFAQVSSYRGSVRGRLEVKRRPEIDFGDRPVLLVEDIIDSGYSVAAVIDVLTEHGARSVDVCTLLDKVPAREIDVPIRYTGFEIADAFVVGYGLDLAERFRNLPYVGVIQEEEG